MKLSSADARHRWHVQRAWPGRQGWQGWHGWHGWHGRVGRVLLGGLLLAPTGALPATGQPVDSHVLRRVPDAAGLTLIVPNLAALETTVNEFGAACTVPEVHVDDLLGSLMRSSAGVSRDGPVIIAGLPADPVAIVLICRLDDEPGWRGANGVGRGGDVFRATLLDVEGYGAIRDSVLMLADRESALKAALEADGRLARELQSRSRGLLESRALLLADVPAWRDQLEPRMSVADAMVQAGLLMSGGARAGRHLKTWQEASRAVRSILSDAATAAVGLEIGSAGARLRAFVAIGPDSPTSRALAEVEPDSGDLLSGLPSGPFALVAGCDWRTAPGLASFSARIAESLAGAANGAEPDGSAMAGRGVSGANVMVAPLDEGQGALVIGGCSTPAPETFVANMLQATSWTHRRETADRVDVEVLALSSPDGAERADVGTAAWLGESLELRLAAADDHVAFVLGSGERAAASMRRLIGGPHTPLSMNTRVRRALESLPDSPRAILLIDAGPAFALTVQAAQSFGAPIPALPLQSTYAPLISLGAWLEADAVRAELFLPAETVREMIDSLRPGSAADRAH